MTVINCRICGHSIHTSKAGPAGKNDLMQGMMNHIRTHPQHLADLTQKMVCMNALILFHDYFRIPANEPELQSEMDALHEIALKMLGVQSSVIAPN